MWKPTNYQSVIVFLKDHHTLCRSGLPLVPFSLVCFFTTHSTQHTAHSTQHTAHSTQHTAHSTQHTTHNTQHTAHNTQHATHSTQHTAHSTQHTTHNLAAALPDPYLLATDPRPYVAFITRRPRTCSPSLTKPSPWLNNSRFPDAAQARHKS